MVLASHIIMTAYGFWLPNDPRGSWSEFVGAATSRIVAEGMHPLAAYKRERSKRPPPMWARGLWKVFLDDVRDILRAIDYVNENPRRAGLPAQSWSFVTPFDEESAPLRGAAERGHA